MSIESKHSYRFVYLKSEKWQAVRLDALVREKGKCQICGDESIHNDAHHMWYPESIWDTTIEHLVILCRPCHGFIHIMVPECKTNNEELGMEKWLFFANAISAWRRSKAEIFPFNQGPKELRLELARLQAELANLKLVGVVTESGPTQTADSQIQAVMKVIKQWANAYKESANSVNSVIAELEYQI